MEEKDNVTELAKYGGLAMWELSAGPETPNHPLYKAKELRRRVRAAVEAHEEAVKAIQADGDLTDTGKRRRIQQAAEERLAALAEMREELHRVEVARDEAVARARETEAPQDKVASVVLGSEIRRYLGDNPLEVRLAYQDAVEAGDFDLLDAVEMSPSIWPGRPDAETMAELTRRRLEVTDPRLGEEVRLLSDAAEDVAGDFTEAEGAFGRVRDELAGVASG